MTASASSNNSFAASVLGKYESDFTTFISAFADWAAFASQMETRNGQNKISARTEYELNNECSNTWVALYGNTTDTKFPYDPTRKLDNRTQFCARLNVAYHENRYAAYLADNPHLDPREVEYNELEAASDMSLLNILVEKEEAWLNYKRLLAKFVMVKNLYETITGAEFVFKPYAITERSTQTAANAKLGAALLKRVAA